MPLGMFWDLISIYQIQHDIAEEVYEEEENNYFPNLR